MNWTSRAFAWVLGALLVSGFASACGGDKTTVDEQLGVDNVSPVGSVGGQILDAETDQPLAGVTVTVVAGAFSAQTTTDSSGVFSVEGVPASGAVLATFSKTGYLSADLTATFQNAAGQFPVENATLTLGPVALVPASGELALAVFGPSGEPAQGHVITLTTRVRFLTIASGQPVSNGSVTVTAQVNAQGVATFQGVPNYWVLGRKVDSLVDVSVPPYDADGDGYYEFPGRVYTFDALELGGVGMGSPETTLVLDPELQYPDDLRIVASNVQGLEGWPLGTYAPDTIPPVGPIYVLFNQPVQEDARVEVYDEAGTTPITPNPRVRGSAMEIHFPTALATGAEYNLRIVARALTGDRLVQGVFNAPFFVIDESADVTLTIALEDPADPTNYNRIVTFSEPVGFGSPGVALGGSAATCAIFFDYNLVGPGPQAGDDPGEWGNESCYQLGQFDVRLVPLEPVPVLPGGAGLSGYTTRWLFTVPPVFGQTMPVPSGTTVHFAFNHVGVAARVMRRVNGQPLGEMVADLP